MKPLNYIMEELDFVPEFVSLDVEGYEYEILKDFNFDKYKVKIFCIEKCMKAVEDLMLQHQYVLEAYTPANWIWVLKN